MVLVCLQWEQQTLMYTAYTLFVLYSALHRWYVIMRYTANNLETLLILRNLMIFSVTEWGCVEDWIIKVCNFGHFVMGTAHYNVSFVCYFSVCLTKVPKILSRKSFWWMISVMTVSTEQSINRISSYNSVCTMQVIIVNSKVHKIVDDIVFISHGFPWI